MRAKNEKKPPRSIRYLLSADRKLKKISLRKMSEHVAKAKAPRRATRSKGAPGGNVIFPWVFTPRALALAFTCAVVATVLIVASSSPPSDAADSVELRPPALAPAAVPPPAPAAAPPVSARSSRAAKAAAPNVAAQKTAAPARVETSRVSEPAAKPSSPVAALNVEAAKPAAKPVTADAAAHATPVTSTSSPLKPDDDFVTVTGCVDDGDGGFVLKNVSGTDAPKSRSWKSGFLRKRAPTLHLIDPANRVNLASYVGRRVAVSGALTERELRPRSLRQIGATCN